MAEHGDNYLLLNVIILYSDSKPNTRRRANQFSQPYEWASVMYCAISNTDKTNYDTVISSSVGLNKIKVIIPIQTSRSQSLTVVLLVAVNAPRQSYKTHGN